MGFKVVVANRHMRVPEGFCDKIRALGASCEVVECFDKDERIAACRDADFVITGLREFPFDRDIIEKLEKTKFIETLGIGYEGADVEAATEHGIGILNNRPLCDDELSDHAMALILAQARWLTGLERRVREGNPVPPASPEAFGHMHVLRDKVLGLIGLGRNGRVTAVKAQAFGMKVICYDPYVDKSVAEERNVTMVDLDQLLRESDYVSIHTLLTPETRHMIGLEEFKKMKPTAHIINVARGPIINQPDLVTALREGYIEGAGLDVTDPDPLPMDHPLFQMDNVILTGHNAGASAEGGVKMWSLPVEQVRRAMQGEWPLWIVNPSMKQAYTAKWGQMREGAVE